MNEKVGQKYKGVPEEEIQEVWHVTAETDELEREREQERVREERIRRGLAKCPVCGGEARMVIFGVGRNGVWIGCDRSAECSRYIEIHTEGWSLDEVAAEWNKYNSGVFRWLRRAKRRLIKLFGAENRAKKAEILKKEAKKEEERAKREQIFGINRGKKRGRWWGIWRKGNK